MDDGLAPLPPKLHFSIDQFGLLTLGNGERRGTEMPLVRNAARNEKKNIMPCDSLMQMTAGMV